MQLRLCSKMSKVQMQNARAGPRYRRPFKIHAKTKKTDEQFAVCVSGGLGDLRRLLAMHGSCGLLNIA